ncbi:MAG: DUF5131 family protein [Planctomycetes bacterium]|nr:DUF5131 family protein [Planctomycetota bacterium]
MDDFNLWVADTATEKNRDTKLDDVTEMKSRNTHHATRKKMASATSVGNKRRTRPLTLNQEVVDRVFDHAFDLGIASSREALNMQLNQMYQQAPRGLIRSQISWTTYGWACIVGCTACSSGCIFCYAKMLHDRRHEIYLKNNGCWKPDGKRMPVQYAKPFGEIQLLTERLGMPLRTRTPGRVFVNASSDVFHEEVPIDYIQKMFLVMGSCPHLRFQILTKRAKRLHELADRLPWFDNIEMGVTVDDHNAVKRAELLKQTPAKTKWVSAEPLLSPLREMNLSGLDWVVAGGETGAKEQKIRAAHPDWYRELRAACREANVAFFFKQTGDWVHESQLADTGLTGSTAGRPIHEWPDGTRSFRFGRVIRHDILDGQKLQEYPTNWASLN